MTYERYLQALRQGDPYSALQVVEQATGKGQSVDEILRTILVPSQREVGRLWMTGQMEVAEEHAATSVAEMVLARVCPPESSAQTDVLVLLACAENEWHTFPPRLAASLARHPRMRVLTLGGSIPASRLHGYLVRAQPSALALSTTLTANLVGAARSIRAAAEAGVPVVVGGAAWGSGEHRAQVLGASAHLTDPALLGPRVFELSGARPLSELPVITDEVALLERLPHDLLLDTLERQRAASTWVRGMSPEQEQHTLDDLAWMARHTAAALLSDDLTIVGDLFDWLLRLLVPRGVPGTVILDSATYLADAIQPAAPAGSAILHTQAQAVRAQLQQSQGVGDV